MPLPHCAPPRARRQRDLAVLTELVWGDSLAKPDVTVGVPGGSAASATRGEAGAPPPVRGLAEAGDGSGQPHLQGSWRGGSTEEHRHFTEREHGLDSGERDGNLHCGQPTSTALKA